MGQSPPPYVQGPEDREPRGGLEITADATAVIWDLSVRLPRRTLWLVIRHYDDNHVTLGWNWDKPKR